MRTGPSVSVPLPLARPELQDVAFCQGMGALQIGGAIAHLVDAAEEQGRGLLGRW